MRNSPPNALEIAAECLKHPRRASIWLPSERRYICPEAAELVRALLAAEAEKGVKTSPPALNIIESNFKLIFWVAAGGTLLFTLICVGLHLAMGGEPPKPMERLIDGMFDLVKIGFGAIAGLLIGKSK